MDKIRKQADLAGFHLDIHDALYEITAVSHLIMPINDKGLVARTQAYIRAIHEGVWIVSLDCKFYLCSGAWL